MTFHVLVRPEARADLSAAVDWYEGQLAGLGQEFLMALDVSLALLERNPEVYQKIYKDVRRTPLARFPFAICYVVREEVVHVIAVLHARRDPQGLKERVSRFLARRK